MSAFSPAFLLAAALAAASPAVPPESPQTAPQPDVVVTGTPARERKQEIRDFVRALTEAPTTGQISRFENAICPAVNGLSGPVGTTVVNRMRQVAAAIGMRVGAADCRPNILLMVTRDKRVLIQEMASRYPHAFGIDPENSPRNIAAEPGPAAAWHATAMLNADGRGLSMNEGAYINRTSHSATRMSSGGRPTFIAAAVVVEQHALEGLSTIQLADYALMRALARIDPRRLPNASPRSILGVLEAPMDSEVPVTITRWDLGFLRGLYGSQANLYAPAHRAEISRRVAAELRSEDETGH